MNYRAQAIAASTLPSFSIDLLMLVISPDHPRTGVAAIDRLLDDAEQMGDLAGKDGQTLYIHRPAGLAAGRLAVAVAAGNSPRQLKAAMVKLMGLTQSAQGVGQVAVCLAQGLVWSADHASAVVGAASECLYQYRLTKPSAPKPRAIKSLVLLCDKDTLKAVNEGVVTGQAVGEGVALAREMGNRPGNYCTPTALADEARRLGKTYRHIKVEVLDRKAIEKIGMGSFLSVTNGSAQPPRFIIMRYEGGAKTQAPVVLVGKGITFDTGGISLKPGAEMDEMKFDMGGAASVLGTFRAVAEIQPKLNVIGLIPTCENMPSGTATKPGDVVTSLSGQTIEVLNTDAEGRLILCDALTYAERLKPAVVVDIATLTGACVIALGAVHSGLFSPDDELASALQQAGDKALDTAWRMPVDDEYGDALKSNFADLGNVGGRAGGAVTAAVFLSKFAKAYRWAHLDIAGTAWKSGAAKGATGRPVGLLTQFLLSQQGGSALKPAPTAARAPSASRAARGTRKAAAK